MLLQSTITCPYCAVAKTEIMLTDARQFFYECTGCGTKLKPKSGDCCVFCSYGSVLCPPDSGPARRRAGHCVVSCLVGDEQRDDGCFAGLAQQQTHQSDRMVDSTRRNPCAQRVYRTLSRPDQRRHATQLAF